jgi:hypothetical protein
MAGRIADDRAFDAALGMTWEVLARSEGFFLNSANRYGGVCTTSGRRTNQILCSVALRSVPARWLFWWAFFSFCGLGSNGPAALSLLREVPHVRPEPGVVGDCARSGHRRRLQTRVTK